MSIDTLQRRYMNGPINARKDAQQHTPQGMQIF